jgi:hypothetical protein
MLETPASRRPCPTRPVRIRKPGALRPVDRRGLGLDQRASNIDAEIGRRVAKQAAELREEVARAPKSRGFKLRARVGRRKRWYEVPDESIT